MTISKYACHYCQLEHLQTKQVIKDDQFSTSFLHNTGSE
uniref:SFRICE_031378 n=1 Tax=Spodoptera frugiperda TaxID=7108 RepID=A0A2H1VVI9_SPOFR